MNNEPFNSLAQLASTEAQRHKMLAPGDCVLAGLSGGADSVALLYWLCSVKEEYGLKIAAAHVNHGLRGEASDGDEAFCQELAKTWGIPLHVRHIDIAEEAQRLGVGIEEAGRCARYSFFGEIAQQIGASKIALAHTLSDRIETFLLNFGRGAALRGLCSIPPTRALNGAPAKLDSPAARQQNCEGSIASDRLRPPQEGDSNNNSNLMAAVKSPLLRGQMMFCQPQGNAVSMMGGGGVQSSKKSNETITIIRPLIACSRAQVEAYCALHGLRYRTDLSNFDDRYRRNAIRQNVLPPLKDAVPGLESAARRMFSALRADEDYLAVKADKLYESAQTGAGEWDAHILAESHTALLGRVLRRIVAETGHDPAFWQIDEFSHILPGDYTMNLSDTLRLRCRRGILRLESYEASPRKRGIHEKFT